MAPRKEITNDAAFKGKAITTTGRRASLPTKNQPPNEDTGSISLQE